MLVLRKQINVLENLLTITWLIIKKKRNTNSQTILDKILDFRLNRKNNIPKISLGAKSHIQKRLSCAYQVEKYSLPKPHSRHLFSR